MKTEKVEIERVTVVAGIIEEDNKILLCKLAKDANYGAGSWYFPGGKVEKGETLAKALDRELFEELKIIDMKFGDSVYYGETAAPEKPNKTYVVTFIHVKSFRSRPRLPKEFDALMWIPIKDSDSMVYFLTVNEIDLMNLDRQAMLKFAEMRKAGTI